jgi:hypothetical protein
MVDVRLMVLMELFLVATLTDQMDCPFDHAVLLKNLASDCLGSLSNPLEQFRIGNAFPFGDQTADFFHLRHLIGADRRWILYVSPQTPISPSSFWEKNELTPISPGRKTN